MASLRRQQASLASPSLLQLTQMVRRPHSRRSDVSGDLSVSALDERTGRSERLAIVAPPPARLTATEIDLLVEEAEASMEALQASLQCETCLALAV